MANTERKQELGSKTPKDESFVAFSVPSKVFTYQQHLIDMKKPFGELLQKVIEQQPGAYIPFEYRLLRQDANDRIELAIQFKQLLAEEKVSIQEKTALTSSKLYLLGLMYMLVPNDHNTAITYYRRAANNGHAGAQTALANPGNPLHKHSLPLILRLTLKMPHETKLALYTAAATQGDYRAQYSLGCLLLSDDEQDEQSESWFREAALRGYPDAWYELSKIYLNSYYNNKPSPTKDPLHWLLEAAAYLCKAADADVLHAIQGITTYMVDPLVDNPKVIYQCMMSLSRWNSRFKKMISIPPTLQDAFWKLADENPQVFLELASQDPWEKVYPLLKATTAEKLKQLSAKEKTEDAKEVPIDEGKSKSQTSTYVKALAASQAGSALWMTSLLSDADRVLVIPTPKPGGP